MNDKHKIIEDQIKYYEERATEYDEWYLRQGRYDRGDEHKKDWFKQFAIAELAMLAAKQSGDILESTSGTAIWTQKPESYS